MDVKVRGQTPPYRGLAMNEIVRFGGERRGGVICCGYKLFALLPT